MMGGEGVRGRSKGEGELCEGIRAPKGGMLTVLSFLLIHFFKYVSRMCCLFFKILFLKTNCHTGYVLRVRRTKT